MATSSNLAKRPVIGIEGLKYAVLDESTDIVGGTPTYGTIYDLPGAVEVNWNPSANLTPLYDDDGLAVVGETVGDMKLDITLSDISQQDLANLLGHTYVNGVVTGNVNDLSVYVAIGGKILRNGTYEYVWFPKVKLTKPSFDYKTKESKIVFQTAKLMGQVAKLAANNVYRNVVRTDDTNVPASTITNWFSSVVYASSPDLTAFTAVLTTGSGATKTLLLTLSKASNSGSTPFVLPTSSLTHLLNALKLVKASDGSVVTFTAALLSAGTGFSNSTITITLTTTGATAAGTAIYAILNAGRGFVDGSGVDITEYFSGSVTTHA